MSDQKQLRTDSILGDPNSNFKIWNEELYLLLNQYDLNKYIKEEIIQKIPVSSIKKENINKYTRVEGDKSKVYSLNVDDKKIKNDNLAKTLIMRSICKDYKLKFNFVSSTAFEIYRIISETYVHAQNERIQVLTKELEDIVYNEKDGSMSMFISSLNNIFNELENLKVIKTNREKFDTLFNAIPKEVIRMSNMFAYTDDWKKCCEVVIETHQHLKYLLEKRNKKYSNNNRTNNSNSQANYSNHNQHRKKPKCQICHRYGHTADRCNQRYEKREDNKSKQRNKEEKINKPKGQSSLVVCGEQDDPTRYVSFAIDYDSDNEKSKNSSASYARSHIKKSKKYPPRH